MLNQPRYKGATILLGAQELRLRLLARARAVGADGLRLSLRDRALVRRHLLQQLFKNGFLPVVLSEAEVDRLFHECNAFPGFRLVVDLGEQTVSTTDGSAAMRFEVDAFRKYCLLNGLDEIGLTLRHADKIRAFEAQRKAQQPWYF